MDWSEQRLVAFGLGGGGQDSLRRIKCGFCVGDVPLSACISM